MNTPDHEQPDTGATALMSLGDILAEYAENFSWIIQRSRRKTDKEGLQGIYHIKYEVLTEFARQNCGLPPVPNLHDDPMDGMCELYKWCLRAERAVKGLPVEAGGINIDTCLHRVEIDGSSYTVSRKAWDFLMEVVRDTKSGWFTLKRPNQSAAGQLAEDIGGEENVSRLLTIDPNRGYQIADTTAVDGVTRHMCQ
jgi:hypothetical protein